MFANCGDTGSIKCTDEDNQAIQDSLNSALDSLRAWVKDNEMKVNLNKATPLIFTLSTKPKDIELIYDGEKLQRTQEVTFLRIVMDTRLNWNKQACKLKGIGSARNGLLKRLTGVKKGTAQNLLCTTYKSYIRPAIECGSELLITASEAVQDSMEI
ncbi:putative RNA-directed DNA polymerase from transposon BS [Nephila pilipes]|uniref:Putative RNA-directed DNA polymerase from transposon BS n=1 Tax=Nephila pilipes TaxID=299642 RepID=A0A8X6Q354_NEPPI|nr:putative RNA-directed DNA polymerase from transposon BS [Nephila pilipes]